MFNKADGAEIFIGGNTAAQVGEEKSQQPA